MVAVLVILLVIFFAGVCIYVRSHTDRDEVAAATDLPSVMPDNCETCQLDGAELIAVIMAAVAEIEGLEKFKVLNISSNACNWALFGRQDLIRSRQ
ncbi:MAG: hypothetical protein H6Q73_1660 [Firmicutes bacterium]|nr:hypothetical protein [Bacillota bacterium]